MLVNALDPLDIEDRLDERLELSDDDMDGTSNLKSFLPVTLRFCILPKFAFDQYGLAPCPA